jgi:hypothetical protein
MATRIDWGIHDRRGDTRQISVLAIGKLIWGSRELFCIVRDVSSGGLRIEMPDAPPCGSYVIVEMLGLNPCAARVAWRDDCQAGLAFATPQCLELMCRRGLDPTGQTTRGPRFAIDRGGELRLDGRRLVVTLVNISAGGARVRCTGEVVPNRPAQLVLNGIGGQWSGYVRWVANGDFGFSFTPALDLHTLLAAISAH